MTNDQITSLAKQVGFHSASILHIYGSVDALCNSEIKELEAIQRFAELVRNEVLEEAAKVCDEAMEGIWQFHPEYVNEVGRNCCTNLAKRIRGLKS